MPDLGLEVLLKGSNMLRLLQGLWVALRISLIAVVISIPSGLLFGVLMTRKNVVLKAIFRVYLEFIRIMPQLVLLFLFYFSTTRTFGWNLSGECDGGMFYPARSALCGIAGGLSYRL